MDATAGIPWSGAADHSLMLRGQICNYAAWVLSLCLAVAAALFMMRRCAGALSGPLPALLLISAGMIAAAAACAVHLLFQSGERAQLVLLRSSAPELLTVAALPVFAAAITLPGSAWPGITLLWLIVGGTELGLWQWRRARRFDDSTRAVRQDALAGGFVPSWLNRAAETATQQLIYYRAADGTSRVEGWLQAQFAAGQRTAIVHVAFCPVFASTPVVEAETQDGPECEIRPTLVLPWGVRWELKLATVSASRVKVNMEFVAHEPSLAASAT